MRAGRTFLVLMLLSMAGAVFAQQSNWLPRYNEESTGVTDASLELPVSLLWKFTTENNAPSLVATPAVGEDTVYVPLGDTIYAIDRHTGALKWDQAAGDTILSSPALVDGILYFGSRDTNLYAVNAEDGSIEWRYRTGGNVDCPPIIVDGVCYFGSDDNRLTALDVQTRQTLWQFEAAGSIKAPPLVYRDTIILGSQGRRIYALNMDGRPIWSNAIQPRAFLASPVAERNVVMYASGRDLYARYLDSGRMVWARPFRAGDLIVGSPSVLGRTVYVGSRDGSIYAIDTTRGRALWRWPAEGAVDPITSSPAIVDDMIVFRAGKRDIIAISLDGREMLFKYSLPPAQERAAPTPATDIMVPGDDWIMDEMPDEAPAPEMHGPGEDRRPTTARPRRAFADLIDPSVAVAENSLFVIAEDGIVYGFSSAAPDNVPPVVADAVLEVPGAARQRVQFTPELVSAGEFPERYARDIEIPGTPPIFLSMLVEDAGSGIDADSIRVTINGEQVDHTFDAREGLLWYIYDPRGAAANLPNGVKRVVVEAVDWRGNTVSKAVSFTIDNRLRPPEPPRPVRPEMPEGMHDFDEFPPDEYMRP